MKLIPDIIDYYELEFITQKFKTTNPIWRSEIIKINRFAKIPKNSDPVKLPYFYSNVTSLFLTKLNVKLQS